MAHDSVRVADTKGWLAKAAEDLEAAEQLLRASPVLRSGAVFHCQQAAEKAMKGFLAWHDVPFRKTHDLEEIGEACLAIDSTLQATVDRAAMLARGVRTDSGSVASAMLTALLRSRLRFFARVGFLDPFQLRGNLSPRGIA